MGGVASVVSIMIGILWMISVSRITSPMGELRSSFSGVARILPLFGLVFISIGIANAIYNFRNATARNRYSILDITDSETEPDPLNERFGQDRNETGEEAPHDAATGDGYPSWGRNERGFGEGRSVAGRGPSGVRSRYCPYCGRSVEPEFRFCPACGRELPESR